MGLAGLVQAVTNYWSETYIDQHQNLGEEGYQQKIYFSSCVSDVQDAQDGQDVNSHSGWDVDVTSRPEDSLNIPLRPDNLLKCKLRPVRADAFRR